MRESCSWKKRNNATDYLSRNMPVYRSKFSSYLSYVTILTAAAVIGLMLLSFPIGAFAFYDGRLGSFFSERVEFPAFLFGLPIGLIRGITLGDAFGALWVLYLVLFVIAINGPLSNVTEMMRKTKNPVRSISRNQAVSIVVAFTSVYLLSIVIELVQQRYGVGSGSLSETNPLVAFVTVSLAPLTEEIGFRVSTVGFFAFAVVSSRAGPLVGIKALWYPQKYLPVTKGGRRNLRTLYLIAVVSGLFFGFAHLLYGGGWEIGKVSTASLAGITLGVMYIKFGIPAAILLHWSFNYFRSAFFYFGDISSGFSLTDVVDIVILITGVTSVLLLVTNLINYFRGK